MLRIFLSSLVTLIFALFGLFIIILLIVALLTASAVLSVPTAVRLLARASLHFFLVVFVLLGATLLLLALLDLLPFILQRFLILFAKVVIKVDAFFVF